MICEICGLFSSERDQRIHLRSAARGAVAAPYLDRLSSLSPAFFSNLLEGTSKGQMLSALSDVKGSGVYVAIERVTGTLAGRTGTFVLLAGSMTIQIADGKHSYQFEYSIEP